MEKKIQTEIVLWYSQEFPEKRGCLFQVDNSTYSAKHGMSKLAMGCVRGASDLVLLSHGKFIGCEIKSPSKDHARSHIEEQLEWGRAIQKNGGDYFIFISLEEFKGYVLFGKLPKYTTRKIALKLSTSKSKIKFD